jgi:glycosyltransferase involved in cell wall biosynthesis
MVKLRKTTGNKLVAGMQIRNEEGRHLHEVLSHLNQWVDEIVIIDDNSTDNSVAICKQFSKVSTIIELKENTFENEIDLRKNLWEEVKKRNPDWILIIDADELFEDKIISKIRSLIDQDEYDVIGFRFFDFWGGKTHYRSDSLWGAHNFYTTFLARYMEDFPEIWLETPVHCGRRPASYDRGLKGIGTDIRIKHFGWSGNEEERYRKYLRYMKIDGDGIYGSLPQYQSILDKNPHLIEWKE